MSREVHNGPTDETQARGTPYSGDPEGGAGTRPEQLEKLPLDAWHRARGGRMVPFAGYEMPVQYEGIMAEHLWTRENAGLFDVSHMGQLLIHGRNVDGALEALMPGDFRAAPDMKPKYSLLLDDDGGIIDDLMATRRGEDFYVVVNGATKHGDIAVMEKRLPGGVVVDFMKEQALLALQGPKAAEVLETIIPGVGDLSFMQGGPFQWRGRGLWISRSGYTGEDGFEISAPSVAVADLADAICAHELAKPIGLGARDSLRLEAGLPLYGHDLDLETTPVMAGLTFAINKRRRAEGGFPGALRILAELEN
ncbi:MAG: glycine cleavage system aminomethyltransferase GcvT, partial [Sphingomicrobium sp.]